MLNFCNARDSPAQGGIVPPQGPADPVANGAPQPQFIYR